ncbi:MAG: DNA replication/repair protein RecF [Gammaproteobacteria bacterium]|nr:DNA replication/repair protein RecF [Gammaproteobacteria bacterium]
MNRIQSLSVTGLRNLSEVVFSPASRLNILYGENGSGKTSLLEAIHLLATGRSFRSTKLDPLITENLDDSLVFAKLEDGLRIGLNKSRRRRHQLRLQEETQRNWESVARALPVQLIDSTAFQLLEGGPKARRKFLDWGVFHVEHSFVGAWRDASKCLANRNALLKQARFDSAQLEAWDRELVTAAEQVDRHRAEYMDRILPVFHEVYQQLDGAHREELCLTYDRGWAAGAGLAEELVRTRDADRRYGSTQTGPHRADIQVRLTRHPAVEILSRGQQKVLVCALKIAQGRLLSGAIGSNCLYLVDDLPSELDPENRARVFASLLSLDAQLFVTCVELESLGAASTEALFAPLSAHEMAQFHVEHGRITA